MAASFLVASSPPPPPLRAPGLPLKLPLTTELPSVLDLREIWYTNLLLLGFDPIAMEDKFKTRFSRDMFAHINKKGMEVVMHFLFSKLNSQMAYQEFRDCWPVYDKKQEQQFRKACTNWLARIAKEEPESRLPRLSASLLLSPGGDKFYQFLLRFASYVLKTDCLRIAKSEEKQVFLPSFLTSSFHDYLRPAHREVTLAAMKAHVVRHFENVTRRLQLTTALHEKWQTYTNELTSEYLSSCKESRSLSKRLASLQEERKRKALNGTPKGQRPLSLADERTLSLSAEVMAMKRKSRMQKVRELWKVVENFEVKSTHQREVVDSVIQGKANRHVINAKDLSFQIPEMLLPEYEALIRQGKAGNTYEAGKLNLLSLTQLCNCALQVLRDDIHDGGVPSFDAGAHYMSTELQAHRTHLASAQKLRASLVELHDSLNNSIHEVQARLQHLRGVPTAQGVQDQTQLLPGEMPRPLFHMPPIIVPSLGLDLLPPSPEKSDVSMSDTHTKEITHLSFPEQSVSTPEAVQNISKSIHLASQRVKRAKPSLLQPPKASSNLTSRIDDLSIFDDSPSSITKASFSEHTPREVTKTLPSKESKRKSKAPKMSVQRPVKPNASSSRTTREARKGTAQMQPPQSSSGKRPDPRSSRMPTHESSKSQQTSLEQTPLSRPKPSSFAAAVPLLETIPRAHDLLADQIAAAVASQSESDLEISSPHTPDLEIHSLVDPLSAMGREAFVSKDKIARTPLTKSVRRRPVMKTTLSPLIQSPAVITTPSSHGSLLITPTSEPSQSLVANTPASTHPREHAHSSSRLLFSQVDTAAVRLGMPPKEHHMSTPPSEPRHGYPLHSLSLSARFETPKASVTQAWIDSEVTAPQDLPPSTVRTHTPITIPSALTTATPQSVLGEDLLSFTTPGLPPSNPALLLSGGISTTLPSTKKVAFEQTPDAATQTYITPTQSPSLFTTVQPPTPFQHANFDLDSSEEEETEDDLSEGSNPEGDHGRFRITDSNPDSILYEQQSPHTKLGSSGEESIELPTTRDAEAGSVISSGEECLELPTTEQLPSGIAVGDLLNLSVPSPHQHVPFTDTITATTEVLIDLQTPARTVASPVDNQSEGPSSQDPLAGYLPPIHSNGTPLAGYLPPIHSNGTPLSSGHQKALQDSTGLNMWLTGTGGGTSGGELGDGSPFLMSLSPSDSPQYSLSLNSDEESLEQSSS